jgi:PAS domain S-box-containing protein
METGRSRLLWNIAKLNSTFHTVILVCLVAIMCYESARLAYLLRIPPDHIASFWPATPFLAGVLLLTPRRIWPALIAAGLGAMALADLENGVPIRSIMWFFLGDLAAVLGATLGMSRLFKGVPHLSSVKTLGKYLAVAVILAPFASGFLGANGKVPGGYWLQWRLWFFSDALAFLTVTPAILNWAREGRAWARKSGNYLELAALMTSLVFFGYLAFMSTGRREPPALLYSLVPLLLWAALRLGLKGVSTSMVVITYLSIWGASHGRGPFTEQGPLNNVLSLQLFLFFAAIPFMFLAVLVEGQKRAQQALINEEARLRESEERFRLAAQGGKMFAYEWDAVSDVIVRSAESAQILGIDETLTTGKQILANVHSDDRERLKSAVAELSSEKPYLQISYRIVRPDGSVIWVQRSSRAQFDEQGRLMRIVGMVADITERKQAEEALKRSESNYRLFVAQSSEGIFCQELERPIPVDLPEDEQVQRILHESYMAECNDALARMYGMSPADFVGKRLTETLDAENPVNIELTRDYIRGGYRVVDRESHEVDPQGNPKVFVNSMIGIVENGMLLRTWGIQRDVTDRRRAEQARVHAEESLRKSEERFRLAAQAGQMYAFEWDVATDKVMRSEEYVNVFGFNDQAKQLTRQQVLASVHADDRALFVGFVDQVTPENPTTRFSYRVLRPDGSVVWLEKNARAFFDEQGRMLRIIGMVADITERKRVEEALSYMSRTVIEAEERERNRIARDLHEDIGQRLALLAIGIEELKDDLPKPTVQLLDRIDSVWKQTLEVSTDVRASAHELYSPRLEYLGIAAVMRSFCGEFGERKRVEIDFRNYPLPTVVPPDVSICLFRVLQEALHNGLKHSGVQEFQVQLWGASDEIHLTVSDSGAGFDLEAARKGRGLGLIRIEQRLSLLKGTFSIDSQPKRGTTIHARVPLSSESTSLHAAG